MEFRKIIGKGHIRTHLCDHIALIPELPGTLAAQHVHWRMATAAEHGRSFDPRHPVETQELPKIHQRSFSFRHPQPRSFTTTSTSTLKIVPRAALPSGS